MNYYPYRESLVKKDCSGAARVIDELYEKKVELEKTPNRIGHACYLLLKENAKRDAATAERPQSWRNHEARDPSTIEHGLMGDQKITCPGWYEKDWHDENVWERATFQEARVLQAKGGSIRFRDSTRVLVAWPSNQSRRDRSTLQAHYKINT